MIKNKDIEGVAIEKVTNIEEVTSLPRTGKHKIFFPNLDGLRFFSFLFVFFSHIFTTQYDYIKETSWYKFFKGRLFFDGDLGVSFFFVLSGFLITYLLLKEREFTSKINVPAFYVRRTLRIWPLYYFCVIFGFNVFPLLKSFFGQIPQETANPVLCSLFLNNFDRIINGPPDASVLSVLWSVAIEEQFYLVWPVVFFLVKPKYYIYVFIAIIVASLTYRSININGPIELHTISVISDMAIGGLGAYLSITSNKFLNIIKSSKGAINLIPYIAALALIIFRYDIFVTEFLVVIKRLITASFFIWIILEQNFCTNSLFKISRLKIVTKLGKYTYGLYCLHPIAILIVVTMLGKLGLNIYSWQIWLIQLPIALLVSIFISYMSFTYFESFFLRLKDRFAYIVKQ